MAIFHRQALLHLLILVSGGSSVSAFTSTSRQPSSIQQPKTFNAYLHRQPLGRNTPSLIHTALKAKIGVDETTNSIASNNDDELTQAIESNNLEKILSHLQQSSSRTASLSKTQTQSILNAIEVATAESDENTVNKRAAEDANISSAAAADVEFQALDRVRAQMTNLYRLLREEGKLNVFGAIGRPPPSSLSVAISPSLEESIYPTSGSKIISPTLLQQITGMEMINLTPRPTNLLLYGGGALAVLEGLVSLYFGINFNLLVVCTLLLALLDQVLVSGAVFETALRLVRPEMSQRITKHEAGHFLCAYLLGCPVEGVVLSTWAALNDGRFGGRSSAISAGTSYYDLDLSEQIAGVKPLTRESIDRYSIIVMGGIAAEAIEFGRADGGAGDEDALVRFLRSLNPRSGNAVSAWTPDLIRNQARWGATQAVLLMKEYKPCYDALVDALERGGDLGQCIVAIEDAAEREGLGWLRQPLGKVTGEGEFGTWVSIDEAANDSSYGVATMNGDTTVSQTNNGSASASTAISTEGTNGVPTYGEDPITSTEEFLKKYRDAMEKKLEKIDEKLEEMDKNSP
mmetsp:Transcript_8552/g.19174  ORF Transcript_8552/g.19174 Transcript_8552/m.19174 type:complete len:573 (-) Transcript_8552:56-1774(-)